MIKALVALRLKVNGNNNEIAPTGPNPGNTPTNVPISVPRKQRNKFCPEKNRYKSIQQTVQ